MNNIILYIALYGGIALLASLILFDEDKPVARNIIVIILCCVLSGQYAYRAATDKLLVKVGVGIGASMLPTLPEEASLELYVAPTDLERTDIVMLKLDEVDDYYCKRIIGMPGETIYIQGDDIYINGELYAELDYEHVHMCHSEINQLWVLADDEYFVLGDNRPVSNDSRYFGPVKASEIKYEYVTNLFTFGNLITKLVD